MAGQPFFPKSSIRVLWYDRVCRVKFSASFLQGSLPPASPAKFSPESPPKPCFSTCYERASQARYLTSTIIATDDERVYEAAKAFGAKVRMTRADHLSGTDRVAEVASAEPAEIIVNIQGDEPLIDPAAIDAAILPMVHDPDIVDGHAEEAHRGSARDRRPQRGEGGYGPRRQRHLFFALPDSLCARGRAREAGALSSTSVCTFTGGISCWGIRRCRWGRWNRRSGWSSCARSKTAIGSGWWKPSTNRWVWIRPKIWNACRRLV